MSQQRRCQLSKIIWGHWELVGVDSVETGESTDCLNSPKATEWDDEEFPTKYVATVQHSKSRFLRYTARLVRTYKVLRFAGDDADDQVELLYRHFYRKPADTDRNTPLLKIPFSLIRRTLADCEVVAAAQKRKHVGDNDEDEADFQVDLKRIKRQMESDGVA